MTKKDRLKTFALEALPRGVSLGEVNRANSVTSLLALMRRPKSKANHRRIIAKLLKFQHQAKAEELQAKIDAEEATNDAQRSA